MKRQITVIIVAAFCLVGCWATVAPPRVVSTQASPDGNNFNSGIIAVEADGFRVTQHFLDRHKIKSSAKGVSKEGDNFLITAELMSNAITLDAARKNTQK